MRAAFCSTVRVRSPRKSILSSPSSSIVVIVNWVVVLPSWARASGTRSSAGSEQMTTPAAWTDVWRGRPSRRLDMSRRRLTFSSPSYAFLRSGFMLRALSSVMPSSLGTILAMLSTKP